LTADERLTFWSAHLEVACAFRDFGRAEEVLVWCERECEGNPWVAFLGARLKEMEDDYGAALASNEVSLRSRPLYRPALQQRAHLLQIMDRAEEALEFLDDVVGRTTCGLLELQRAQLLGELGRFEGALEGYDRFLELSPLADGHYRRWVNGQRLALACRAGDLGRARVFVGMLPGEGQGELRGRLGEEGREWVRRVLPVDFVRQHHLTCAPATLSALARYWGRRAEHLELADAICYDGTSSYAERKWAGGAGYVVREFTVTWESAVALIDRGVPFTVGTTETTSGHLQAVVGYEELRRVLILRDPFHYYLREAMAPAFFERYAAHGPRGMVMVPEGEAWRLEGVELPDADLYDSLWQVTAALDRHDRDAAKRVLVGMEEGHGVHRVVCFAGWALARYDNNTADVLRRVEQLLAKYPTDGSLLATRLDCLRVLRDRRTRVAALEEQVERGHPEPLFLAWLGNELRQDGRELERAGVMLRRALRSSPTEPDLLSSYAAYLVDAGELDWSHEVARLAACAGERREHYSRLYFESSRALRRSGEALEFLRARHRRLGRRSGEPASTLCDVLTELSREEEAGEVLGEALKWRPEDGELLLFAVRWLAWHGSVGEARECLARAEGRTQRTAWLRGAAALADREGDRVRSIGIWREVVGVEPLAVDAQRALVWALEEGEGHAAALGHLEEVCGRFPQHCGLLGLLVELQRRHGVEAYEAALRRLISVNPADAFAYRELASRLEDVGRVEEALEFAERAIELDPDNSFGFSVRGAVHLRAGRMEVGRGDLERAVCLSVENGYAVERFVGTATTAVARSAALDLVQAELVRQVVFDTALFAFQSAARGVLSPDLLLARLREAQGVRPDLWCAWGALVVQLRDMDRLEEALELGVGACERFPFVPRLWVELAEVRLARLEFGEGAEALERALELNPGYSMAADELADIYRRMGEMERARGVLERVLVHAPLVAANHGCLAEVLWECGQRDAALERMLQALQLDAEYTWAWRMLEEWSSELARPEVVIGAAEALTQRRPQEASSWRRLAEVLARCGESARGLEAVERALGLDGKDVSAYELKARIFTAMDRFDEAIECCRVGVFSERPAGLVAREAWVEESRGRDKVALERMREALELDPGMYRGWQFVAERLTEAGDYAGAADAADHMARLAPQHPVPLGFAADLRLRMGDRAGAVERLDRAFQMDREYGYAGWQLARIYLEDDRLEEAGGVVELLRRHHAGVVTEAYGVVLLVKQGRGEEALEAFRRLCGLPEEGDWCVGYAAAGLDAGGMVGEVNRVLGELVRGEGLNPQVVVLWVGRCLGGWGRGDVQVVGRLAGDERLREPVLGAVCDLLVEGWSGAGGFFAGWDRRRAGRRFSRLWKEHAGVLQGSDFLWGKVSYVLASMGRYGELLEWMGDWRDRGEVESWMLYNYALGLVITGRGEEALEVLQHALSQRMEAGMYRSLAVVAAFELAAIGNVGDARGLLQSVVLEREPGVTRSLHFMAEAMLVEAGADSGARVRALLRDAFDTWRPAKMGPLVGVTYRRLLGRLRGRGMVWSWFWGWVRYW
jgi:tetratricopeptide (TPR) repeat protein